MKSLEMEISLKDRMQARVESYSNNALLDASQLSHVKADGDIFITYTAGLPEDHKSRTCL